MASPYTSSPATWQPELRSMAPVTNNRQSDGRYSSAPRMGGAPSTSATANEPFTTTRSMTPNRYAGVYNRQDDSFGAGPGPGEPRTPSSTGLIRLSLKKPMGIVFEPMYDPNQPSLQRGVRICDLPRTGAAALSRKLQVGDELLQINDTTVSRLTFDEIMDFIIEADPESVNLLFRRPRKETLQARQGVQQKLNAANREGGSTVKWVDEEQDDKKAKDRNSERPKDVARTVEKRSKKGSVSEEEETLQSSTAGEDSYVKSKSKSKKKAKRRDPYQSESFLDLLIDTICSNSNNVCRDTFRRNEDDYVSEDESFASEVEDEDTYITYEESLDAAPRNGKKIVRKSVSDDDETDRDYEHRRKSSARQDKDLKAPTKTDKKYEDDGTLETMDTTDRAKEDTANNHVAQHPLGLVPNVPPAPQPATVNVGGQSDTDDDGNPAPIRELEYDDRIDHGADVSVMESLGGPSLLIEKQRAAQQATLQQASTPLVPQEIMQTFGLDYPPNFGMSREQTISADPLKFYTYVVRGLLEEHEPEKVRLLDKLLAKYKGREDHLVQKLSVRYNHNAEPSSQPMPEDDGAAFTDAVKKSKASINAAAVVNSAKERLLASSPVSDNDNSDHWPEKEQKEPDEGDIEEPSESESEFSRDSVDGTSPAVIAQVSELLNYVYGKTSVPGQIDRVSTIMRAYEGREAVLLELLETKALIKANKEKENADNLPAFLRHSHVTAQAQKNADEFETSELPPVTPMATQPQGGTVIQDDISSMSGVSSPAVEHETSGALNHSMDEVEVTHAISKPEIKSVPMKEAPKINVGTLGKQVITKPPVTPDKRKKKGLFGGLFSKKKGKDGITTPGSRASSRTRTSRKLKGVKSIEGSI